MWSTPLKLLPECANLKLQVSRNSFEEQNITLKNDLTCDVELLLSFCFIAAVVAVSSVAATNTKRHNTLEASPPEQGNRALYMTNAVAISAGVWVEPDNPLSERIPRLIFIFLYQIVFFRFIVHDYDTFGRENTAIERWAL